MSIWGSNKPNKPTDIDEFDDIIYDGDDFLTPPQHSSDDIDSIIDDEMFDEISNDFLDDGDNDDEPTTKSTGFFSRKTKRTIKHDNDDDDSFDDDDDELEDGFSNSTDNNMKFKVIGIAVISILLIGFAVITIASKIDESSNVANEGGVSTVEPISPTQYTEEPMTTTTDSVNPTEEVGTSVSSEGKEGNHDSGINAIIGYDNAFYLDRNPDVAWSYNSPNNSMTKSRLEEAILGNGDNTGVAPGTKYIATITPKVVGKTYDVDLELIVDGKSYEYKQVIEVEEIDGKFYVKNIKNNE